MTEPAIPFELLVAYVAGELASDARTEAENLIAASSTAAATVQRLQEYLRVYRADDSTPVPAETLLQAKALFSERPGAQPTGVFESLKRAMAELIYDSRPQLALAGVRGAGRTYQLAYESELADIDLDIEFLDSPEAEERRVRGQVSLREGAQINGIAFAKPGTDESLATADPDQHGVFSVTTERGTFDVLITLPNATVVLPNVEVE